MTSALFDCYLPRKLHSKAYLSSEDIDARLHTVNFLSIGGEAFRDYLDTKCEVQRRESTLPGADYGIIKQVQQCGQTMFLSLTEDPADTKAAKEELSLRLQGRLPISHTAPLRPGGWFSRVFLGRRYAVENEDVRQRPHGVIIGGHVADEWVVKECNRYNVPIHRVGPNISAMIPVISRELKHQLIRDILTRKGAATLRRAYTQGFTQGETEATSSMHHRVREAEQTGYQKGKAEVAHGTAVFPLPSETLPPHLCCPLTKASFVDPVLTKYGDSYEGTAIREYVAKHGCDPLTKAPLEESELYPNRVGRDFLRFLKTHGVNM